jgi:hypothetical protein
LRLEDGDAELLDLPEPEADDARDDEATDLDLWRFDPFDFREAAEMEDFLDDLEADERPDNDPLEERDLDLEAPIDADALLDFVTALSSLSLSEPEVETFLDTLDFELFVDGAEASDAELERERLLREEADREFSEGLGEGLEPASGRAAFNSTFAAFKSAFDTCTSGAGGSEMLFDVPFERLAADGDFAFFGLVFLPEPKPLVLGSFDSVVIGLKTTSRGAESSMSPFAAAFPTSRLAEANILDFFAGSVSWFRVICKSSTPGS